MGVPELQALSHPNEFVPSLFEYRLVHLPGQATFEIGVALEVVSQSTEPGGAEVSEARREAHSENIEEAEHDDRYNRRYVSSAIGSSAPFRF